MRVAASAGISLTDYEYMTPAELAIYVNAWAETQQRGMYMAASLISMMVGASLAGKHSPSYEAIFGRNNDLAASKTAKKQMTDRQMYNAVLALNRAFGGAVTQEVD